MGRRLSQLCPPYATPSSNSSLDYRRSDARTVENGSATSGGLSKSAKVVLAPALCQDSALLAQAASNSASPNAHPRLRRHAHALTAPVTTMVPTFHHPGYARHNHSGDAIVILP